MPQLYSAYCTYRIAINQSASGRFVLTAYELSQFKKVGIVSEVERVYIHTAKEILDEFGVEEEEVTNVFARRR